MDFELAKIKTEINIVGFHSIYYFEFDKNFYSTPEKHDFWELVYVDSGKIIAIADKIGCTLTQGQVIFYRPMELHSHVSNKKDPNNLLIISFSCKKEDKIMEFFEKKIFELENSSKKILSLFLSEAKNALVSIPNKYEDKSPLDFSEAKLGSVQLLQCYLTEFLFSVIRSSEGSIQPIYHTQSAKTMAENSAIEVITNYLADNIGISLSLDDICEKFAISKPYLCKTFRLAKGESPIKYFTQLKIMEAKRLIREGQNNMAQISEILGYKSIYHFSRMFKKFAGISPLEYKRSINK
ncbi:MAG: AraC family transcriptional regulator [Oscillospiraceae bacterium]|nr:AraC family transcriptional regulator [Oscillospiraceae bacterium]